MSKPTVQLGGKNWATKSQKILAFAEGDTSGKYIPRELVFDRDCDLAATRINKDGLVEKYRENKFTYSSDFRGSSDWTHNGLHLHYGPYNNSHLIPDGEEGYDGGSGKVNWILSSDTTGAVHRMHLSSLSSNAIQTISIYAKALGYSWIRVGTNTDAMSAYFDLENGEIGTVGANVIDTQMISVGNGWYRCAISVKTGSTITRIDFNIADGDGVKQFDGDRNKGGTNRGGIYVMDAQWELGPSLTDYIDSVGATTGKAGLLDDFARIDYTNNEAQLLLEPSKTNLLLRSETTQGTGGGATITYLPEEVNPAGFKGGVLEVSDILEGQVGDRWHTDEATINPDSGDALTYTGSMFVKGESGKTIKYYIKRTSSTDGDSDGDNYAGADAQYLTFDGTWQRVESTFDSLAVNDGARLFLGSSGSTPPTADKVKIWGMQIERSDFATSYIPTYGTTDTRKFDKATFGYDAATDAWTIYMDVSNMNLNGAGSDQGHMFFRGQSDNTISALFFFGTCFGYRTTDTAAPQYPTKYICSGLGVSGTVFNGKWAVTYDGANTIKVYVDGSLYSTKTDVDATPTKGIQSFGLQYNSDNSNTRRSIREFKIYDKELSQSEAEALTA